MKRHAKIVEFRPSPATERVIQAGIGNTAEIVEIRGRFRKRAKKKGRKLPFAIQPPGADSPDCA